MGTQLIDEKDFTTKFMESGEAEADNLIKVYNQMIDNLRSERLKLQEQNYFLDKILNASPSAIITFDFNNKISILNPSAEKLLGVKSLDVVGKHIIDLGTAFALLLDQIKIGESKVVNLGNTRRVKCQKLFFLDKGFARNFLIIDELTEELRTSEKVAYEKLIRMMSHEVNNSVGSVNSLLNSCLYYSSQIREGDREDFESAIGVVISRTAQLSQFMKSLAEVVKVPAPKRSVCELLPILKNVVNLMQAESQKRNIEWIWVVEQDFQVMLDKIQMEQVFVNLFKNSIEAIEEKGKITVKLDCQEKRNRLTIEDTGKGIEPEIASNLFTPFFSTKKDGQGIGLTLVQEILNQHDFEYSLESLPSKVTRFIILF